MHVKSPEDDESFSKHCQESTGSGEDLGELGSEEEGWCELEWTVEPPLFCWFWYISATYTQMEVDD